MPFIIRHKTKEAKDCVELDFKIKIDPGSKYTGIAITDLKNNVYFKAIIEHRGQVVVSNLKIKHGSRRNRRNRKTRYRRCKYKKNQKATSNRPEGWLPPSIISIEQNIINWVKKLHKYVNIVECSIEDVRIDMQKLENSEIKGMEYQQGTLQGITIKDYLHNKYGYTCQYCGGAAKDKKIEIEHIISKKNGGTNKINNLTLSCHKCNQDKGNLNLINWCEKLKTSTNELDKIRVKIISDFLNNHITKPKNYGAWINSYHKKLIEDIKKMNFKKIELSDGITTQLNRIKTGYIKEHYNDAICIGNIPSKFKDYTTVAIIIKAKGRGTRLKGKVNCCGILSKNNIHRNKTFNDFQTGDICKIEIKKGKYKGIYISRISIRHDGRFDFKQNGKRYTTRHKNCKIIQKVDGYEYEFKCIN